MTHLDLERSTDTTKIDFVQEMKNIIAQARYHEVCHFLKQHKHGHVQILKATLKSAISVILHHRNQHADAEFYRRSIAEARCSHQDVSFTLDLFMLGLYQASDAIPQASSLLTSLNDAFVDPDVLTLLLWAKPDWLGSYIRQELKREAWHSFNYHCLRFLEDLQLIRFEPELFALSIAKIPEMQHSYRLEVQAQYIRLHLKESAQDAPELLARLRTQLSQYEQHPQAVGRLNQIHPLRETISIQQHLQFYRNDQTASQRDLPLLLQYESYIDEYWAHLWVEIFQQCLDEQIFDRLSFLQHCLDVQNSHWHKGLKRFFLTIFLNNQPNISEILHVQPSLFALLHHPEKSILQFAHNQIKSLIFLAEFKQAEWLSWLDAIMIRTDLKVLVKSLLIIFEKLLKQNNPQHAQLIALCCDALLQTDLDVQARATQLIVQYATTEDDATIRAKLALYAPALMAEHGALLHAWLSTPTTQHVDEATYTSYVLQDKHQTTYLKPEHKIELAKDPHEWLFLLQRYSQSKNPIDAELFLASGLQLQSQLPSNLKQFLQPILQYLSGYSETLHEAIFKQLLNAFLDESHTDPIAERYCHLGMLYHLPFAQFEQFNRQMKNKQTLGFLSTPTHTPCLIEPKILLQRLLDYQNQQVEIDLCDLALALCRMPRENITDALALVAELHSPQLRLLMQFALGELTLDNQQFPTDAFVGLNQTETALYSGLWMSVAHTYDFHPMLLQHLATVPSQNLLDESLSSVYARLHPQHVRFRYVETYLYEQIYALSHSHRDTQTQHPISMHAPWIATLTPLHRIEQHAVFAQNFYADPTLMPEFFTQHLAILFSQNTTSADLCDQPLNAYQELILALGILHQDKTVRLASIHLLADAIQHGFLHLEYFAEHCIHLLQTHAFPFSRLTDRLHELKQLNDANNDAVLQIISHSLPCIAQLPERPKQLKKYLEIYYQLLHHFQQRATAKILYILQQWQAESVSLNSIVNKIVAL